MQSPPLSSLPAWGVNLWPLPTAPRQAVKTPRQGTSGFHWEGGATCTRSAVAIGYARALTSGHVCDTFDHAYHAAAAAGGDTVRVKNGSYTGAAFTLDTSKNGGRTSFVPQTKYGVTLTSPTVFGPNVGFISIKDFVVNSPKGGFLNSSFGISRNITIDGNRINVGQKVDGTPAGIYFYSNIDTYKIINNVIGPSCCGATNRSSPEGIRIGKASQTAPNANNVLINGNTIQYVVRSCTYWPATGYGPCPDTTCTASGCHNDGIHLWGIQNSTISNNRLYNAEVKGSSSRTPRAPSIRTWRSSITPFRLWAAAWLSI